MPKGKILVAGTFDFLHPGHVDFFCQARKHGDYLVAVVARDENAEKFKKRKPYFEQAERLALVSSLKAVDRAVLGGSGDFFAVVRKEKPDVIVLGYDQWPDESVLRKALDGAKLTRTRIFRANPFYEKKYKSSRIRKHFERY